MLLKQINQAKFMKLCMDMNYVMEQPMKRLSNFHSTDASSFLSCSVSSKALKILSSCGPIEYSQELTWISPFSFLSFDARWKCPWKIKGVVSFKGPFWYCSHGNLHNIQVNICSVTLVSHWDHILFWWLTGCGIVTDIINRHKQATQFIVDQKNLYNDIYFCCTYPFLAISESYLPFISVTIY